MIDDARTTCARRTSNPAKVTDSGWGSVTGAHLIKAERTRLQAFHRRGARMLGEADYSCEEWDVRGSNAAAGAPLELCTAVGLLGDQGERVDWRGLLGKNFSVLFEPVLVPSDVLNCLVLRHPGVELGGRSVRRGVTWNGDETGGHDGGVAG